MTLTNKRGIFALVDVRERQSTGNWPVKIDVWLPFSDVNFINFDTGVISTPTSGYFGGGYSPTYSTVDRINYANDTATALIRGPLSSARYHTGATSNNSYGWFGGGSGPKSTVDRIDYFNDTATASPRGPLSAARTQLSALGNSSYGYFGGGLATVAVSRVDRIDYSNDTATASPRGPLSLSRYRLASTGNSSYGWFGGGETGTKSTVDRIDYSNDTATASVRGPLPTTINAHTATSAAANGLPQ